MIKKQIVHCFNKGAVTYDTAAFVQANVAEQLAQRIAQVAPKNILEIGCGTGIFSQHLLTQFPEATLLLTDISPAMVDVCRRRFHSISTIAVDCQDGEALKIEEKFDLIVSSMTMQWFAQPEKSIANIIKKLTPGGQLIFATLGENSLHEWKELCRRYQINIPTPSFFSEEKLKKHFSQLDIHVETIQPYYPSLYEFLKSLKKLGAVATHENYSAISAGKLRHIMRQHHQKIKISYEVFFGRYINV